MDARCDACPMEVRSFRDQTQTGEKHGSSGMRYGRLPQGKEVIILDRFGRNKILTLRKTIPKKCSAPRRICIKCKTSVIHKNSKNYDLKICEACE